MDTRLWEIPNPFMKEDGQLMQAGEDWAPQKAYLQRILEEDLYGKAPEFKGKVYSVTEYEQELWEGKGIFTVARAYFCDDPEASFRQEELAEADLVNFKIAAIRPAGDEVSVPIVLNAGFVDEELAKLAVDHGFSVMTYDFFGVAPDTWDFKDAMIAKKYPDYDWMLIRIWAWMQSRVIDWLYTQNFADTGKVVAAGHSRYGKTSLCCGIYDPRVAVCVAAGSGCGGMGSLRRAGGRYGEGTGFVETLGWMMRDHSMLDHWFKGELKAYGDVTRVSEHYRENELRFDADFIGSAIAPTPLLVLEGLEDNWANPFGTQLSWNAVSEVYHYLGLDDKLAIHFREGGHAFNYEDWTIMIDFCRHVLFGEEKKSNYKTRAELEIRVGHDWTNPLDYGKPALTYDDIMASNRKMYAKHREEHRWAFGDAHFGMSMAEMFALYFGKK